MRLFKNRRHIEKKLAEKFKDFQSKPDPALWDRIARDIPESTFENKIHDVFQNHVIDPDSQVWLKLEEQLDDTNHKTTWWKYASLLLLIGSTVMASFYIASIFSPNKTQNHAGSSLDIPEKDYPSRLLQQNGTKSDPILQDFTKEQITEKPSNVDKREPMKSTRNAIELKQSDDTESEASKLPRRNNKFLSERVTPRLQHAQNSSLENVPVIIKTDTEENTAPSPTLSRIENDIPPTIVLGMSLASNTETKPASDPSKSAPRDSTVTRMFVSDTTKNTIKAAGQSDEQSGLTRWSLSVQGGINYGMMRLESPEKGRYPLDENTALRNAVEQPETDWMASFLVDYRLSKNWKISSGLGRIQFSQSFLFNITPPINGVSAQEPVGMFVNDSIIPGNSFSSSIRYSWTEVPILITYTTSRKSKFNYFIQAGLSFGFLTGMDAAMINYDNVGVLIITSKESFPGFRNTLFFNSSVGVSYTLNPTVDLKIIPSFRLGLNNMIENSEWVKQYPVIPGLSFGITKRF